MQRRDGLALAFVAALMIAYVAPYAYATLASDTVRDLLAAHAIARGELLPLAGPPINYSIHLGPVWLYLESIPLLVSSTATAAMLFAGALAGAKFPLAYWCGERLVSQRFGLCFAAALALPSVAIFQALLPMHPGLVEAALLLALYCTLRAASSGFDRWVFASALALGVAIQLHPTALFYAPLLFGWLLLRRNVPFARRVLHVFAAMLIASVWFWPTLASDIFAVRNEASTLRAGDVSGRASVEGALNVAHAFLVKIPYAIAGSHLSRSGMPSAAALALLCILATTLIVGLMLVVTRGDRAMRGRVLAAVALFVAGLAIVSSMRSYVSFYTTYFLLPLAAFVAAASLLMLLDARARLLQFAGLAAIASIALTHGIASYRAIEYGRDAFLRSALPALGDLGHGKVAVVAASTFPAATRDAVGRYICTLGDAISLHGDIAYQVAGAYSLDTLLACNAKLRPTIGGREPANPDAHLYGLSRGLLRELGRTPEHWAGRIGVGRPLAIVHPPSGVKAEATFSYFEQAPDRGALERLLLAFDVTRDATIAIYNLKPFDSKFEIGAVSADGQRVEPALRTFDATFFVAPRGTAGTVHWSIEIETDVSRWIDVFAF